MVDMSVSRMQQMLQRAGAMLAALGLVFSEARPSRKRGGRGRKRGRRAAGANKQGKDKDADKLKRKSRGKIEEALHTCGELAPLPPEITWSNNDMPTAETWRFLLLPNHGELLPGGVRFHEVEHTEHREQNCRDLFVGGQPPGRNKEEGNSVFTCVLMSGQDGEDGDALFASDYNIDRGIPNFVAFVLPRDSDEAIRMPPADQEPALAHSEIDAGYVPGDIEPCCWCTGDEKSWSEGGGAPSEDCGDAANARGHFVPLFAFRRPVHSAAADTFLNTVPMRRPFIEAQWYRKLHELWDRVRFISKRKGRRLHILMGPSVQTDGRLPTNPPSNRSIEVPSFVWMTYADPHAVAAGGNICRNGGEDNDCACVDGVKASDLEKRLGFQLYPGMHPTPHHLDYFHVGVHHSEFLYAGGFVFIVMGTIACLFLVVFPDKGKETSRERNRKIKTAADKEAADREERLRRKLESAAGGKEALRARFRAV